MNKTFVFLADGFEEIEALTAVDVMRRGGMEVKTVSITSSLQVRGAHGITVIADVIYDSTLFAQPSWLVLPGGMPGAENLYNFAPLQGLLQRQAKSANGNIAAICAAPGIVLGQLGLLNGRKATCYPGFEKYMQGAEATGEPVTIDGNIVMGNGPANALRWALAIVAKEKGAECAREVAAGMLHYASSDEKLDNYFG